MTIQDHLDILWRTSQRIKVNKTILIGDLHLGVRNNADDFDGHDNLFLSSISPYLDKGYSLLLGGDITDDWENPNRSKIMEKYPEIWTIFRKFCIYQIQGNHDPSPLFTLFPMAFVLQLKSGKEILWSHGHVGDFFNYQASWLGKFFVRYIWRNLQMTGIFKDPTTSTVRNPKKHEATKLAFLDWAQTRKKEVIFHHTHFATEGPAYNAGAWTGIGGQAIIIEGNEIKKQVFV